MAKQTWSVSIYKEGVIEIDTDEMTIEEAAEDWASNFEVNYELLEEG